MSDMRIDALADNWQPPIGLLSWQERHDLDDDARRTLARNRLGIYELLCGSCSRLVAIHRDDLPDGEIWFCSDCRATTS
jgi:hypothetical protein